MDAVELPYPVDVAAPKLIGSEGFGRAGVTVKEVESRESDSVPALVGRTVERCSSFMSQKDKIQLVKQKNHLNSKRSEKRNPRVPAKNKYDSFPVKAGSASFSTASGGSNFLGVYGLKSDAPDVTKLIDDFSLIGLLDGTYEAPNLGKDKGKKEGIMSDTLMQSVRKAGSILEPLRPVQSQKFAEIDSPYKKLSTCLSTTVPCGVNGGREETCTPDLPSGDKYQDSSSKPDTLGDVLDFPLYQPRDILERLALPPPKDLESLLLDAAKPTMSSRNTPDPRSGKQIARRPSLPAFPWSYSFSGQSRTNADMIKLSTSKNTCLGRWGRIGNTAGALRVANDCFSNLDSLKYDNNLVPSEHTIVPYISGKQPWFEWGSSSSATCSKASDVSLESGGGVKYDENAENCPKIVAAAQTLMDMATLPMRQNTDGLIAWQKKASQKASKVRKSRPHDKGQETSTAPMPFTGSENPSRSGADQAFPSKKPKLSSVTEKKKDHGATNSVRKGPINWSTPRSVRSSPSKSARDSIAEPRHHSSTNAMKQSSMMPPPTRVVLDKACSEHKMRNFVMEWRNGEMDSIAETRDSSSSIAKQASMMPPPARVSDKAPDSEQKRKASDFEERPRSSDKMAINWHYGGRDSITETRHSSSHIAKHSSMMPPPPRILEKSRDSEQKIRKLVVDWNSGVRDSVAESRHSSTNTTKQTSMMPPPSRVFDKACEIEQKRKASDNEDRQRKLAIDKMTDWRNLGARERSE